MKSFRSCLLSATFLVDVLYGGITQNAKKSIFPTSDAVRENVFMARLFGPSIATGEFTQEATGSYTCGVPSKFRLEATGFEIHSPYAPYHDDGGLSVERVENEYKLKWDNLRDDTNDWYYDAILDNNMAFWVTDLETFTGYSEDSIDRVYLQWEYKGITYYSLITHNKEEGNDMNQYEFISDTFSNKDLYNINFINSEPRATIDDEVANYKTQCEENDYSIVEIGIRKAVSNLQDNLDWYIDIFRGSLLDPNSQIISGEFNDINGNIVKYGHILLQKDDSFMISFFERKGEKDTYGSYSIKQFEEELIESHKNVMVNPFCCTDRWYDLHFAMPLNDDVAAASTLDLIMPRENELYTVFEITKEGGENEGKGMFWTMMEPNGQIIQLQGPDSESELINIEWATQPLYWDGAWCPQDNTDEFQKYTFGDKIAEITYVNKADIIDDNSSNDESETFINFYENLSSKSLLLTIIIPLFAAMILGCIYYLFADKWIKKYNNNNEDKKQINQKQDNNSSLSYTYKTFE